MDRSSLEYAAPARLWSQRTMVQPRRFVLTPAWVGSALRFATVVLDVVASVATLRVLGGGFRTGFAVLAIPLLVAVWLVVLRKTGGYRRSLAYPLSLEFASVCRAAVAGVLALVLIGPQLGFQTVDATPGGFLLAIAFLAAGRIVLRLTGWVLRRRRLLVRRVLIIGDGEDAVEVLQNITAWPGLGVEVVGICSESSSPAIQETPVLGRPSECAQVVARESVATVILAPSALDPDSVLRICTELQDARVDLVVVSALAHLDSRRISIDQLGGLPLLQLKRRHGPIAKAVKRALDTVAATALLILLSPLLATIAAIVRIDSAGPVLFRQRRVGQHGSTFVLWKFRTMQHGAETNLASIHSDGHADGLFKCRHDPRLTRAGRRLRRTSLDELPQLWNVLRGEMSLVGPRPALPHEIARFDELTLRRLRAKPGMTGLWQISGRAQATFLTYSRMDAYYADNWTLLGDLKILLHTIPTVLRARGAY